MSKDYRTFSMYMSSGRQQETWNVTAKGKLLLVTSANGHVMDSVKVDQDIDKAVQLVEAELPVTPYKSAEWERLMKDTQSAKYYI